ncbi:unnamed protein product [Dimorphilus gyrociliatus]|uniref:Tetraspanin n=1 Tax=Dimorphilus gyrociliatus TaxID=2664684 RepID=A0A7I8VAN0_9ANNE|nr:unnamed protein product [Dimorphilus gyrociliatus]
MGCGTGLCKGILFTFNFLFWLSGLAIAAIAVWILVDPNMLNYIDLSNEILDKDYAKYALYVMIGVGVFVLAVGFCGCCGALTESVWMLVTYATFLVIIFAAELAFGVLAMIFRGEIDDKIKDKGSELITKKYNVDTAFTSLIHFAQVKLKCCGLKEGLADFPTGEEMPWSCCVFKTAIEDKDNFQNAIKFSTYEDDMKDKDKCKNKEDDYIWKATCYEKLKTEVEDNIVILAGVGIGIAAIQIVGFIIACFLCCTLRRKAK